jgi:hypothetical protein
MALEKPKLTKLTKGGIRKTPKMLNEELWKLDRVFKVLAIDPASGIGVLAGDEVYLSPDNIGQVIELEIDKQTILMVSCFAVLGIASKVPRGASLPKIDPDLKGAEPMVHDEKTGKHTLVMGAEGKS